MTFLTILRVIEILCSFRLVLEEKTGKEIPQSSRLDFLEKVSANNFALSEAGDNYSGSLKSKFTFVENTISNLPKVPRTRLLWSDGLFCFSGICKFVVAYANFFCLTHLHDFQLLALLPEFIEITFFIWTNRINHLNLK